MSRNSTTLSIGFSREESQLNTLLVQLHRSDLS